MRLASKCVCRRYGLKDPRNFRRGCRSGENVLGAVVGEALLDPRIRYSGAGYPMTVVSEIQAEAEIEDLAERKPWSQVLAKLIRR